MLPLKNGRKKTRVLTLFILTMGLSLSTFNLFTLKLFSVNPKIDEFLDDKSNLDVFQDKDPKTSSYPQTFENSGDDINITLHQSYVNTSFDTIVNTSIINGNNFTLPCPMDKLFNSTYTNITARDIFAPNYTLIVEDDDEGSVGFHEIDFNGNYLSFEAQSPGYITNVSLKLKEIADYDTYIIVKLYNSEYSIPLSRIVPKNLIGTLTSKAEVDGLSYFWWNLGNLHQFFNNSESETYGNTFFIQVQKHSDSTGGISNHIVSAGAYDSGGIDSDPESIVLDSSGNLVQISFDTIDLGLKLVLAPLNNTPNPEDIGLQINNKNIIGYANINGSGYWESLIVNGSNSGILKYNVSADWWDVQCNITQVQINYTKTDLKATSNFEVSGSGQEITWNVTRSGGLNYFDTNFNNYTINFTIPATWNDASIEVFNSSDDRTGSLIKTLLGNGYRDIKIPNAGNGTYWFLNATSTNLINSIDTYVGGIAINDFANFTNIVRFNVTFSEMIMNGTLNLTIYSPTPNYLNHSQIINLYSLDSDTEFNVTDWDLSLNATKYGVFDTRIAWNNGTAAGFLIGNLTILGETELTFDPLIPSTFDASDIFNITISFNDTEKNEGISNVDTNINYSLNGGLDWRYDNYTYIGDGQYHITINCNDSQFINYGQQNIIINASKQYYNNQSKTIDITILGETNLVRSIPKTSFDSSEIFNITLYFNDTVKNIGINSSSEYNNIYVNGTLYTPLDYYDYGDGNYNVTVNCSADVFISAQEYGSFNLSIIVEKSYYHNKTTWFIIDITGDTSLSATKFPVPPEGYYNSDETFNITVYFNDTSRNEGIDEGQVNVYVKEVSVSSYTNYTSYTTIVPGSVTGEYNFTVNCSDDVFSNYGKFDIKINVTKSNYYTASYLFAGELIIGNTTLTILEPIMPVSYVEDEVFHIIIEYMDHTQTSGIINAIINYSLNGATYRTDNYVDKGDGTYNITINANDAEFGTDYGNLNITIRANQTNYINLTRTFIFERQILTQIEPLNPPALIEVIKGNSIFYTFNYSDKLGSPIVKYDIFQNTSYLYNFEWNLVNVGQGNYTLELNSSKVTVIETPYTITFSIYAFGNETQEISFTILVTIIQTSIEIESWNELADFARSTIINISIDFTFNDTTNNDVITGLEDDILNNIKINDYYADTTWIPGFKLFTRGGPEYYTLNISTLGVNSGDYRLELNISKYPNYNWSLAYIDFTLRGNYTQINMISVSDPEEILTPIGIGYNYTTFVGSDLLIEFNMTDLEFGNDNITGDADEYIITYKNLNTMASGILQHTFGFYFHPTIPDYGTYRGNVSTSIFTEVDNYLINITVLRLNYENVTFSFNLTLVNSQINTVSISNLNGDLKPSGLYNYYNSSIALDIAIEFNITDTDSLNKLIARNAQSYTVKYINLDTGGNGIIINNFAFNSPTSTYLGNIITSGLPAGNYLINVSTVILKYKIIPLIFNLTIIYTNSNIVSITNVGGQLSLVGEYYESTVATDIDIDFNTKDANFGDVIQIGAGISYTVYYTNLDISENGIILHTFAEIPPIHSGSLDISLFPTGNYLITIAINKSSNLVGNFSFNLRILLAQSNVLTITNVGGQLTPVGGYYESTVATDIDIDFNTKDANFGVVIQIGAGISYTVYYTNLDTSENGIILHSITENLPIHSGSLDISSHPTGNYLITIAINKSSNLVSTFNFNLRIVLAQSNILSISNPGGQLSPSMIDSFYTTFVGSNISIGFNVTDANFGNVIQIGVGISYSVFYENIDTMENGTLQHSLTELISSYSGFLNITQLPSGNYTFIITIEITSNTVTILSFNLRIINKYDTRITVVYQPDELTAGDSFTIVLKVEYYNGTDWVALVGTGVIITPYYDGIAASPTAPTSTNSTGDVRFEITVPSDAKNMTLVVTIQGAYNYLGDTLGISNIIVNAPPSGLSFGDLMPYLILIGAAVAIGGGSLGVYKGVIVPKKREKERILTEVKTIFDDAINLEHILIIYKGTGTCVFFKSFGSDKIDPELISGFLSAICSFGKDLVWQEELNEISYGEKMLLLTDGEHIRVALVLGKKASLILRKNLREFIDVFEKTYANELPNWRGQLDLFRNAGTIIDEMLNTSIILPHEITYEFSTMKALKNTHSREVLKITEQLMKDSERNFFFIATLLKEANEKTGKDTAEIFMGIKELRDQKILMPIEISSIETPKISQQELNLITQKISGLVDLVPEEKEKLIADLARLGPAEREAYFASMTEQYEIVSVPVDTKPELTVIDSIKKAKKEIKNLKKKALSAKKDKDYDNSIKTYQRGTKIATDWELHGEFQELEDIIRITKIEDLKNKKVSLEKEAKLAAKEESYNEAAQKYKMASKIASEIFKLGGTDMTKEVKRLSNKSKEYERLI